MTRAPTGALCSARTSAFSAARPAFRRSDSDPAPAEPGLFTNQDLQAKYLYLPPAALNMVSQALNVPMIDIISVVSFYNAFSLKPRGKHIISVCMGTACHVKGAANIMAATSLSTSPPRGTTAGV